MSYFVAPRRRGDTVGLGREFGAGGFESESIPGLNRLRVRGLGFGHATAGVKPRWLRVASFGFRVSWFGFKLIEGVGSTHAQAQCTVSGLVSEKAHNLDALKQPLDKLHYRFEFKLKRSNHEIHYATRCLLAMLKHSCGNFH